MRVIELGMTDFLEAYTIQKRLVTQVADGLSENALLVTEHWPVITVGRRGSHKNILKSPEFLSNRGIQIYDIDRGGDVTYHGPGQIVVYPIFKLENEARDIHLFLNFLEDIGCSFVQQYGFSAERRPGFRGVWIEDTKIASIGIGVKRWVTYHGMSINVNINLLPFLFIRPCGIEDVKITSLKELLGQKVDIADAKQRLVSLFKEVSLLVKTIDKG